MKKNKRIRPILEPLQSDTAILGNYRITLEEGYPICTPDGQIWRYFIERIQFTPGLEISNWAMELCPDHQVVSFEPEAEVSGSPAQPCLIEIGVERQIKWDRPNQESWDNGVSFTFTLSECYQPTEINVAIKGGPECFFGVIIGPGCEPVKAAIHVEKFVSPDGGTTWFDADTPPGPSVPQGTNPVFRFVVTNTGTVTLSNITLVDSVLGPITIPTTTLAPGESFAVQVTGTWAQGQQMNVATVTGDYEGVTYTDTDPAHYVGVKAGIDVEKYVSVDGGKTWIDADTPPGPYAPPGTKVKFKFEVTNTGAVTLTDVKVTDNVFGMIGTLASLAPGESFEWIITKK